MAIIYSAKEIAKILDKAYITVRGWLTRYEDGEDVAAKFRPFYPQRFGRDWFFARINDPVERATQEDVEAEKARLRGKG